MTIDKDVAVAVAGTPDVAIRLAGTVDVVVALNETAASVLKRAEAHTAPVEPLAAPCAAEARPRPVPSRPAGPRIGPLRDPTRPARL
jgi:hypothetical protein